MNYLQELLDAYYLMRDNEELLLERRYTQDERNTALEQYTAGLSKGAGLAGQTEKYIDKKGKEGVRAKREAMGQLNIFKTPSGPVSFEPVSGSLPWFKEKSKNENDIKDNQRLKVYVGRLLANLPAEDPEKDTDEPQKETVQAKPDYLSRAKEINQQELEIRLQQAAQLRQQKFESEHDPKISDAIFDATQTSMGIFSSQKFTQLWLGIANEKLKAAASIEDLQLRSLLTAQAEDLKAQIEEYSKLGNTDIVDLMSGIIAPELKSPFRKTSILTKLANPKYYISVEKTSTGGLLIKKLSDNSDVRTVTFENHVRSSAAEAIRGLSSATKSLSEGNDIKYEDLLFLQNLQFDEKGKNLRILSHSGAHEGLILSDLQDNHPLVMLAKTYNELLNDLIKKESDKTKKEEYEKIKCPFKGSLSRLTTGEGKADSQLYAQIGNFAERVSTVTIPLFHQLRTATTAEEKQKIYSDLYRRVILIRDKFNSEVLSDITKTMLSQGLGDVAISQEAAQYISELKEYAVKINGNRDEHAVRNLISHIVETGLRASAETYGKRRMPLDGFVVGEKVNVSAKKPDVIEGYGSEEEARISLRNEGIPDSQIESILLSRKSIEGYYVKDGLRNPNFAIGFAVGLKTVLSLKDGVKFGTTMMTSYLKNSKEPSRFSKSIHGKFSAMTGVLKSIDYSGLTIVDETDEDNDDDTEEGTETQPEAATTEKDKKKKTYVISKESLSKVREGFSEQLDSIDIEAALGSKPTEKQLSVYKELRSRISTTETVDGMIQLMNDMRHQLTVDGLKTMYNKGPEGKKSASQELLNMLKYSTSSTDFGMISQIQTFGEKNPKSICVSHNHMLDFYIDQITNNSMEYDFEIGETGGFAFYKYAVNVDKNGVKKRVKDKRGKYKKTKMGKVYLKRLKSSSQVQTYFQEEGLNTYIAENPDAKASNSTGQVKNSATNDSTSLLVNFLKGQKDLLEQLLSKY